MDNKINKSNKALHIFSIELNRREYVKCLVIPTDIKEKVLIEGFLGDLEEAKIIEDVMLELKGSNGTLKMDISINEIINLLRMHTQ